MIKPLYEDNHVIVCYKEKGILSQPDSTGDKDILSMVKEYVKLKYQKTGNVYIGLVHRLDRMTSGIMVFARTSKAAMRLANDMQNGDFHKEYLAVVEGTFQDYSEQKLVNYLSKDEKNNKSYLDPNGKEAILYFQPIKEKNNKTLVKIRLLTGRHHQIRVQMSNINHPLYGDIKYGAKSEGNLALQAYKLSFYQPVTRELLTFEQIDYSDIFKLFK